jgi:carotenoid cleavage dioxygenase-like enzyme
MDATRNSDSPEQDMTSNGNWFRDGLFAPVTEEVTAFDLPVTGHVPSELNGRYLRNGPNFMRGVDDGKHHWFLGSGMVHGVRLRDGRAEWYRNRWVRSKAVAEALGEEWREGPIRDQDLAANTHILAHAGRILATVENGALPYEISDELNTIGPYDFGGTLPAGFTAHTKTDRRKGEVHAVAYSSRQDHVQHIIIDKVGQVSHITQIAVSDRPMMHDFALSEKYVVLYDLPATFSLDAAKAGKFPYVWNPAHEPRVGLLSRENSSRGARWFPVDPCIVFHTLNAYDDGDRVCVDVCRYAGRYDVSLMTGPGPITLDRWTIDPVSGKVTLRSLSDRFFQEFPRVDDRLVSRPHRYGYTTSFKQLQDNVVAPVTLISHTSGNVLLKHDLGSGTVEEHRFEHGAAGEAVFVPVSPGAAEDEGYVMAYAHDLNCGRTDLVILAAQDFAGEPVARIHLPIRVPLGFHGSWIADS